MGELFGEERIKIHKLPLWISSFVVEGGKEGGGG